MSAVPGPVLLRIVEERLAAFLKALDAIPDEKLFHPPVPGGNSPGTLALHVVGNFRKMVGLIAGGIPYERNRPYEFSARDVPRADLVAGVHEALAVARQVLPRMTEEDFLAPAEAPMFKGETRGEHAVRSVEHVGYHTGQIVLLAKLYT